MAVIKILQHTHKTHEYEISYVICEMACFSAIQNCILRTFYDMEEQS